MSRPRENRPPGLEKRRRANGAIRCYWRAKEQYVAAGYSPAVVALPGDWNDPRDRQIIADRCRRLEAEMLAYVDGRPRPGRPAGTIAWLCDQYQTHKGSPYHTRRRGTQAFYDTYIRAIVAAVGEVRPEDVTGPDIRRWHDNWARPTREGGEPRIRTAQAIISTLKVVVAFGVELKDSGAREMQAVMSAMRFPTPARRRIAMSAEQAASIQSTALEMGFPSMAIAVALQFWTALRQRDVIGEWLPDAGARDGAIRRPGHRWHIGLVWGEHIDPVTLDMRKPTSKSNGRVTVEHALAEIPAVVAALDAVPLERRVGPVVIDEATGVPYTPRSFVRRFRKIATAAGVPATVWNMDARAGAITDALNASADPVAVMKSAGHTQLSTTMGYNRGEKVQSLAVARARLKRS